jgi:hypothetical protein
MEHGNRAANHTSFSKRSKLISSARDFLGNDPTCWRSTMLGGVGDLKIGMKRPGKL